MSRGWLKYNDPDDVVWVTDLYGRDRWLTRGQVRLYQLLLTLIDNGTTKMRLIAESLGVSPSTVSRGMAKLMAYGLVAYVSGRGRYGGTIILRRTSRLDGFERFAQKARDRLKRLWQTTHRRSQERLSRLISNVASMHPGQETGTMTHYPLPITHMDATLKRAWTPEELREAGIV